MANLFLRQATYLSKYLDVLAAVILYYDHAITFPEELRYIWSNARKRRPILFLLNRYFAFFAHITVGIGIFWDFQSTESCRAFLVFRQCTLVVTCYIVETAKLLRTNALYSDDRHVRALVASVSVLLSVVSLWAAASNQKLMVFTDPECSVVPESRATALRLGAAWMAAFIYDLLIFLLTIHKTYCQRSQSSGRSGLISVIKRDGAAYFGVMACAQAINILTFIVLPLDLAGLLVEVSLSISVTMMSRAMLNLHREVSHVQGYETSMADLDSHTAPRGRSSAAAAI